jgi:hypothetical protein
MSFSLRIFYIGVLTSFRAFISTIINLVHRVPISSNWSIYITFWPFYTPTAVQAIESVSWWLPLLFFLELYLYLFGLLESLSLVFYTLEISSIRSISSLSFTPGRRLSFFPSKRSLRYRKIIDSSIFLSSSVSAFIFYKKYLIKEKKACPIFVSLQ